MPTGRGRQWGRARHPRGTWRWKLATRTAHCSGLWSWPSTCGRPLPIAADHVRPYPTMSARVKPCLTTQGCVRPCWTVLDRVGPVPATLNCAQSQTEDRERERERDCRYLVPAAKPAPPGSVRVPPPPPPPPAPVPAPCTTARGRLGIYGNGVAMCLKSIVWRVRGLVFMRWNGVSRGPWPFRSMGALK